MHRVKHIEYDPEDVYSDDDVAEEETQQEYTAEDRQNFTDLTPVVRAELSEAGLQASGREIEDALWHYYWDVGKSVAYLKNTRTPRTQQPSGGKKEKAKAKSKFDEAAERSAGKTASFQSMATDWFEGISWSSIPLELQGHLVPVYPQSRPGLLGGSSKLAKLAEERRKKAAASQTAPASLSSLDRLGKQKENVEPQAKPEPRKYPARQKREPTTPPKEPSPEPEEVKEDIPDLRTSPTAFGKILASTSSNIDGKREMTLEDLIQGLTVEDAFKGPSPDDNSAQSKQSSSKSLSKQTEALKLGDAQSSLSSPTPVQPKIKSKGLNVAKLWSEAHRKPAAAFVVIGHVDHGKSTLMGRLLLDTGAVAQRDIDKYKKQATEMNRASFALAWVLDTTDDERSRGITVDVAQYPFQTPTTDFTILDAPGHRDFVPAMLAGAAMADLAVLVVDANQLSSGMSELGQTREHILLAWASGIRRVIVAVNKLDATAPQPWDQAAFNTVKNEVSKLLHAAGFDDNSLTFVPCSGLSGINVVHPAPAKDSTSWISNTFPTLLAALETAATAISPPTTETITAPLRLQISDVFRASIQNPLSISGRLDFGSLQPGEALLIQPSGATATIKSIDAPSGDSRPWAVAGDLCTLHLADIDAVNLRAGDIACSASAPVPVTKIFVARVQALAPLLPQPVDVHVGRSHLAGKIAALISVVDGEDAVVRRKPRVVKVGERGVVRVVLEGEGAPLGVGARVVLRSGGVTVAAGRVERVVGG